RGWARWFFVCLMRPTRLRVSFVYIFFWSELRGGGVGRGGRFTSVNVSENNVAAWVTLELLLL
ncbi:hypothetical protein, partial [Escherichia coli]|uniref:hypothetical protein n=1 Tax=Escherichia coli TaxID=562 RepID=UPI001BC8AEC8